MTEDRKPNPNRTPANLTNTDGKREAPVADNTDFGQPVASPGTRGGTTSYGGVVRGSRRTDLPDSEKGSG